jgi:hypothetical protein
VQAAYHKANETGVDMAWQNTILTIKTMAAGEGVKVRRSRAI